MPRHGKLPPVGGMSLVRRIGAQASSEGGGRRPCGRGGGQPANPLRAVGLAGARACGCGCIRPDTHGTPPRGPILATGTPGPRRGFGFAFSGASSPSQSLLQAAAPRGEREASGLLAWLLG